MSGLIVDGASLIFGVFKACYRFLIENPPVAADDELRVGCDSADYIFCGSS